jgi:hypothetical protein
MKYNSARLVKGQSDIFLSICFIASATAAQALRLKGTAAERIRKLRPCR